MAIVIAIVDAGVALDLRDQLEGAPADVGDLAEPLTMLVGRPAVDATRQFELDDGAQDLIVPEERPTPPVEKEDERDEEFDGSGYEW